MTSTIGIVEWLGYTASALVLVSLTMSSIAKLRWFSLAGASCFSVYGGLISAIPIMVVNAGIVVVNVYYLARMHIQKDYFKILHVNSDDPYLADFLDFYKRDIRKWYPDFNGSLENDYLVLFTLRNMAVAGVFAGTHSDDSTLCV